MIISEISYQNLIGFLIVNHQGWRKCGNREGPSREIVNACRKLITSKSNKIM